MRKGISTAPGAVAATRGPTEPIRGPSIILAFRADLGVGVDFDFIAPVGAVGDEFRQFEQTQVIIVGGGDHVAGLDDD